MRSLSIAAISVLMSISSGCAVSNQHRMYDVDGPDAPTYPRISLLVNDGYVSKSTSCSQYGCTTHVNKTHINALEFLRETGRFESVEMNNAYVPYKLVMDTEDASPGIDPYSYTKFLLAAATLFLLPMRYEVTYDAKFVLMHKDEPIDRFQYKREAVVWHFLFINLGSYDRNAYNSMLSNLLHDIDQRDSFGTHERTLDVADNNPPARSVH